MDRAVVIANPKPSAIFQPKLKTYHPSFVSLTLSTFIMNNVVVRGK